MLLQEKLKNAISDANFEIVSEILDLKDERGYPFVDINNGFGNVQTALLWALWGFGNYTANEEKKAQRTAAMKKIVTKILMLRDPDGNLLSDINKTVINGFSVTSVLLYTTDIPDHIRHELFHQIMDLRDPEGNLLLDVTASKANIPLLKMALDLPKDSFLASLLDVRDIDGNKALHVNEVKHSTTVLDKAHDRHCKTKEFTHPPIKRELIRQAGGLTSREISESGISPQPVSPSREVWHPKLYEVTQLSKEEETAIWEYIQQRIERTKDKKNKTLYTINSSQACSSSQADLSIPQLPEIRRKQLLSRFNAIKKQINEPVKPPKYIQESSSSPSSSSDIVSIPNVVAMSSEQATININAFRDSKQNTHADATTRTIAGSIKNLEKFYGNIDENACMNEVEAFLKVFDYSDKNTYSELTETDKRDYANSFFQLIKARASFEYGHLNGFNYQKIMSLVWMAIKDNRIEAVHPDHRKQLENFVDTTSKNEFLKQFVITKQTALINQFIDGHLTYWESNPNSGSDICIGGGVHKMVESLNMSHSQVVILTAGKPPTLAASELALSHAKDEISSRPLLKQYDIYKTWDDGFDISPPSAWSQYYKEICDSARKLVETIFNDLLKISDVEDIIENFKYLPQPETSKIISNFLEQINKINDNHADNRRSQVTKQFKLNIQELPKKISDQKRLLDRLACGYTLFIYFERTQTHIASFNNRSRLLNETNQTIVNLLHEITENYDYSAHLAILEKELNIKALLKLDELFQKTHTLLQVSQNSLYNFIVNIFLNFFDSYYENRETIITKLNEPLLQKINLYCEILSFFADHKKIEALTQLRNMPDTQLDLNTETLENFLLELIQAYIKNPLAYNHKNRNDVMHLLKLTVELGNPHMVEALIQGRRPDAYEEKELQLISGLIFNEFIYIPELEEMQPYSYQFIESEELTFEATLLHIAVIHGHDNIVKILIKSGSNINTISKGDIQYSPLYFAAKMNHDEIGIYLLENDEVLRDERNDKIVSIWKEVRQKTNKIAQEQFQSVLNDHQQLQYLIHEYGLNYTLFSMKSDGLDKGQNLHDQACQLNHTNLSKSIYEILCGPLQVSIQYPYLQAIFRTEFFELDFLKKVTKAKQNIAIHAVHDAREYNFELLFKLLTVDNVDSRSNLLKLAKDKSCYELAYKITSFFTTEEEMDFENNQKIINYIAQDCLKKKQSKLAKKFFNLLTSPTHRIVYLEKALNQHLVNYLLLTSSFKDVNDCLEKLCEISGKHPGIAQQMSITLSDVTMNVLTMISKQDHEGVLLITKLLFINIVFKELKIIKEEEKNCSEQFLQLIENKSCKNHDNYQVSEVASASLPMEPPPHEEQRNIASQKQSQKSGWLAFFDAFTTSDNDKAESSFTRRNR